MKRSFALLALAVVLVGLSLNFKLESLNLIAHAGLFVPVDTTKGPKIQFNEEVHEFGKIEQNTMAETQFIIKNVGTDTLEIFSNSPSCGCTAAVLDNKRIAPGAVTRLKVTFDPHNKAEGPVVKTITVVSNAVNGAQRTLRIQGEIFKSKTAHTGAAMSIQHVFEGACASCHVEKGKGELGAKLYEADCAICHGSKAEFKPGADITDASMMEHDIKSWKKIITEGIPNSNMPAFGTKSKGPLGEDEIESLVDYLKAFKKNFVREKQMKSTAPAGSTN